MGSFNARRQLPCQGQGTHACMDAVRSGYRVSLLFFGASCVLCSNNHMLVLAGEAQCFQRV